MELSKRLRMNAELVPKGAKVADIGCDHGYVSIYLARNKSCQVIAMDVNPGPLSAARRNIAALGMTGVIACRLSDGLAELVPGEVDTLLIAGMGGMLVKSILEKEPKVVKTVNTLVLQPQSDVREVRKLLFALGFHIEKEAFCVDSGKNYVAILARRESGNQTGPEECGDFDKLTPYSEAELLYGRYLPQKKEEGYYQYLLQEKEKYQGLLEKLKAERSGKCHTRVSELRHILDLLEQVIRTCAKEVCADGGEYDCYTGK